MGFNDIYLLQQVAAALMFVAILSYVIVGHKLKKALLTALLLVLTLIHYSIVFSIALLGVRITIYPLTYAEVLDSFRSLSPDYGQISIIVIIAVWRKEIALLTKKALKSFKQVVRERNKSRSS
ncbi:MAG: hypothetical protein QW369_03475 [Desulfurococcaceae archaeon]